MDTRTILRMRTALDRIDELATFVASTTEVEASSDRMSRAAIERQVELVGLSMKSIVEHDPELAPEIPDAPSIVELADEILHQYDTVSFASVWHAASTTIPTLTTEIRTLMEALEGTLPELSPTGEVVQLVTDNLQAIVSLCVAHRIARLSVFGSAVHGTFDPETSDLDFVVDLGGYEPGVSHRFIHFAESIEHLFGRSVDLVTLSERTRPWFREEIERTAVLLYDCHHVDTAEH